MKPSHVYLTAWSRQATEEENIKVNAGIVRTVLEAVAPARSVKHVALVTGLKHYLGPFEAYVARRRCSADAVAGGAAASGPPELLL